MILRQLFDQETWTYTYLLADPVTREAVLIDPVIDQVERDLKLILELDLKLVYILETHVHADHVTGAGVLRTRTGAMTVASAAAGVECVDQSVSDSERLRFGTLELEVRATPGHTEGCVTYVVEAVGQTFAFTGDALFIRGCGRTDFQGGDARSLYQSVHGQIFSLPADAVIYPGHDYKGHRSTTVAEERSHNQRLGVAVGEDEFVQIMNNLNLADPKRMDVAVPANLACGLPVAPEIKESEPSALADLDRYRILDVRQPDEHAGPLSPLGNAHLIPVQWVESKVRDWGRNEAILVACHSGRRSRQVAERLQEMGFRDVTNLTGGMGAWHELKRSKDGEVAQ